MALISTSIIETVSKFTLSLVFLDTNMIPDACETQHFRPPDPLQGTTRKKDGVTINHEHLHCAFTATLITYVIDPKLLSLPFLVLGLAATAGLMLAPVAKIKQFLDPSFLKIQ